MYFELERILPVVSMGVCMSTLMALLNPETSNLIQKQVAAEFFEFDANPVMTYRHLKTRCGLSLRLRCSQSPNMMLSIKGSA